MKNNKSAIALIAALMLIGPMAVAEAQYPEPFEPKVLIQNAELIEKHSQAKPVDSKLASTPKASEPSHSKSTSNYPEPVEPKILIQDKDLIEKSGKAASSGSASSAIKVTAVAGAEQATQKKEESLMDNLPIILGALGVIGFVVWSMKRSKASFDSGAVAAHFVSAQPAMAAAVAGSTGVARYIGGLPEVAAEPTTGVAKYLKNLPVVEPEAPVETGVSKYLKSLPKAPVRPTDDSGVAKYIKKLG